MRRTLLVGVLTVALLVALGVWQGPRLLGRDAAAAERAARAVGVAWTAGTLSDLTWSPTGVADPPAAVAALTAGLSPAEDERPTAVTVAGVTGDRDRRTASLDVRWELGAPWSYRTQLPLVRSGGRWLPELTPPVVHPALRDGLVLRARAVQAPRAPITGGDGTPLVTERPVVTVGLQPSRASDPVTAARTAATLIGVDPAPLVTRVLPRSRTPSSRSSRCVGRRTTPSATGCAPCPASSCARAPASSRPRRPSPARCSAPSARRPPRGWPPAPGGSAPTSRWGCRACRSASTPSCPARPACASRRSRRPVPVPRPAPPPSSRSAARRRAGARDRAAATLDPRVQRAADAALAAAPEGRRAALVALRPSTGDVLAVANAGPDGPGTTAR